MGGSPAAAAIAAPRAAATGHAERLEVLLADAYPGMGRELAERLPPATQDTDPGFCWLRIPLWLAAGFGLDATPRGRALLDDLCWLQYCVYGVFRVQDDLVDGECDEPHQAVQTNSLLVEAARCAARHFDGDSALWEVFQESIDATSRAIVFLGRLQRSPDRDPERELALYGELSASLEIAAAGVCFASGRDSFWWHQLSPALDAFAVATQIVDDLHDLQDDLEVGCINHAAWFLSHPVFSTVPEAVAAVIASNLATTDRLDRLLDRIAGRMDAALERLERELCPPVYDHLRAYRRGLVGLAARIQRSRVVVLASSAKKR